MGLIQRAYCILNDGPWSKTIINQIDQDWELATLEKREELFEMLKGFYFAVTDGDVYTKPMYPVRQDFIQAFRRQIETAR